MIYLVYLASFIALLPETAGREYCWETFNASCASDEVILMTTARYGRMRLGRCINRDYYIGCSADILTNTDRKCSGRRECELAVPDTDLHTLQPCPKDLLTYMEADYSCVKVASNKDRICMGKPITLNETSGYISSIISQETGFGTSKCPWVIKVPSGQRINLTLFDFGLAETAASRDSSMCNLYASIQEPGKGGADVTLCGGERREKPVYLSTGNQLEVEIIASERVENLPYFMLKYEAIGCPNIVAPINGWVKRLDDRVTLSCNNSAETWHLVCSDNKWIGEFSNCSNGAAFKNQSDEDRRTIPYGLIIAVIIGVILGICIGALLLSLVLFCQKRLRHKQHRGHPLQSTEPNPDKTHILRTGEYGYAHVWELQQLRPTMDPRDPRNVRDPRDQRVCHAHPQPQQHAGQTMQGRPQPKRPIPVPIPPMPPGGSEGTVLTRQGSAQRPKEHQYESPKMLQGDVAGPLRDARGVCPFYDEFEANNSVPNVTINSDDMEARYT